VIGWTRVHCEVTRTSFSGLGRVLLGLRVSCSMLSCDSVTIDGVWIGNPIYLTTLYKSLSHTD
jgi:hypothetical protein